MIKIVQHRVFWDPFANSGRVEITLQNGANTTLPLSTMNEFIIATQLLLHPTAYAVPYGTTYHLVGER